MDVLDLLVADHRRAESMVDGLIGSQPGPERETRLAELEETLAVHMAIEEKYVDPLVQRYVGLPRQAGADRAHHRTRDALARLRELAADPGFGEAAAALRADLAQHASEEESVVFPQLRERALADIAALGAPEEMALAIRAELMTRTELAEAARRAGTPRWYDMSEADLRESFIEGAINASDDIRRELSGES